MPGKNSRVLRDWLIVAAAFLAAGVWRAAQKKGPETLTVPSDGNVEEVSVNRAEGSGVTVVFGEPIFLEKQPDGSFHAVTDVIRADKVLYFDAERGGWYDEFTGCLLRQNAARYPPVWQYRYDAVSPDYPDGGWMEHGEEGWRIETAAGQWSPLPETCDTAGLWYIE